ncbi:MAG TPA: hypothetical protein VGO62_04120 [Myxococcota bacterium]|jgi:hypothetical protein
MGFDRRREKSFGEPTRVRADGTTGDSRSDELPKRPANTAYERYKQELHAFFNGEKPLPEHLKDMLATRPGAAEHGLEVVEDEAKPQQPKAQQPQKAETKARRVINGPSDDVLAIVEQIRRANSPREVEVAVDALRAKGASLPKDPEVLSKALGHGNEDVLAEALRGLCEIEQSKIKSPSLLKTRVKNVLLLASTSELKDLGARLLKRLA